MDKNIIKNHLNTRFVSEAKDVTPGIAVTAAVNKKSGTINKAGVKSIENDVKGYDKDFKKSADMVGNKVNYNGDSEKEYHDQMEIMNGQEMIEYDREPNDTFKERAKEAIEGSSRMGNAIGANAEATWGASSDDFGKNLVKNIKASTEKRQKNVPILSFGDDIEVLPSSTKQKANHSAFNENKNNENTQIKESMKRLKFKKEFNGVGNALKMIPESYKVDNKQFEMTDGNESYKIRWEGTLSEGRAIVLMASDSKMISEDMQKMKHLMGYKSQETLGLVKGKSRLDENAAFGDIWNKSKTLLEGEEMEDADAKEGDLDDAVSKAPEATKHVEGSVSSDKGGVAPAPKTGSLESLDNAKTQASEAKAHVEGSVSSDKGGVAPAPKTGVWDKISVPQAADAKKHITMSEGIELGGQFFAFINENEEENVDYTMGSDDENQLPNPPAELHIKEGDEETEEETEEEK